MTYPFVTSWILEDSINSADDRLTTFVLEYPRFIHAELLTHRALSKNASSSRAVPGARMLEHATRDVVLPLRWGMNQPGMQAAPGNLTAEDAARAEAIWRRMAEACAEGVRELHELKLHKQWANRPLEWFSTIKVLVTATDWDNFFTLRDHPNAQPELEYLAHMMREKMKANEPRRVKGRDRTDALDWHLPFVTLEERFHHRDAPVFLARLSAARCCRISYLNHEGKASTLEEDLDRFERLVKEQPIHSSPLEHQAYPAVTEQGGSWRKRNFQGWCQFRCVVEEDWPHGLWGSEK